MHQVQQVALATYAVDTQPEFFRRFGVVQLRQAFVQYPFQHGPGHFREPRYEIAVVAGKASDGVDRIRNQLRPLREVGHDQPVSRRLAAAALVNQGGRFGVPFDRHTEGQRRCLAGHVIGGGTNPATRQHDVAFIDCRAQCVRDAGFIVGQEMRGSQGNTALVQQLDDSPQMSVLALSREDFVTYDEQLNLIHESLLGCRTPLSPSADRAARSAGIAFADLFAGLSHLGNLSHVAFGQCWRRSSGAELE